MSNWKERFGNLTPEQQKLLKMRLQQRTQSNDSGETTVGESEPVPKRRSVDFSLFFFSADGTAAGSEKYKLLMDAAHFADTNGFKAVWTPERHFQAFGGLYPNPSVLSAALAVSTKNVQIRAGSVVVPLHHPIRIAEEWALVDNLSNGRTGIAFATGWHKLSLCRLFTNPDLDTLHSARTHNSRSLSPSHSRHARRFRGHASWIC